MPTYEYRCDACGHELEAFQSITAKALKKCPACGKLKLTRLISGGGAILFKGGGFYETDYRSESYQKAQKAEIDAAKPKDDLKAAAKDTKKASDAKDKKPAAEKSASATAKPASKPKAKTKA